jgi:hypothetical protein
MVHYTLIFPILFAHKQHEIIVPITLFLNKNGDVCFSNQKICLLITTRFSVDPNDHPFKQIP